MENTQIPKITKIDKHIPIPPPQRKGKYPFLSMEVGDSFSVEILSPNNVIAIFTSVSQRTKRSNNGWRWTCRSIIENGKKIVRVWRIK